MRSTVSVRVEKLGRDATMVGPISTTELIDAFELRFFLERHCAQLAARRVTAQQLEKMERVLASVAQLGDGDLDRLLAIDRRFHRMVYAACDNEFLADVLTRLYDLSVPVWRLGQSGLEDGRAWIDQHRELLIALRAGDDAEAGRLAQQHIAEFQSSLNALL
ncbi:MAG: GntR family transcriptional regulator [Anaerolineae bacterium]|jgi:DNA-binding GntR family transcriptional regulator